MSLPAILGGPPVRQTPFPRRRTMREAEKRAALDVLDSDCLSGFLGAPGPFFDGGEKVRAFEAAWAQAVGARHALSFNSLTTGLMAAMGALGLEPGDEVICPPYTMSASAVSALFYGGIPVFADIDPETFCIDPRSVKARLSPRTRAVVAVHLFGHPADLDALLAVCEPRGIAIVEDAAQAPGCRYRGRAVGTVGRIGGFSLNYHKHIHTGEGGMMTTHDPALARRMSLIRNHGENAVDEADSDESLANTIGGNYRLTELQAAIGLVQLTRLAGILEGRRRLAARLGERLAGIPGLEGAVTRPDCDHAFYVYPIRYRPELVGLSRGAFVRAVAAELPASLGWETTPLAEGYVKPLYLAPAFQRRIALGQRGFPFHLSAVNYAPGLCPVTEDAYARTLLVSPLVREPLTETDIDDFAEALARVAAHAAQIAERLGAPPTDAPMTPTRLAGLTNVR